ITGEGRMLGARPHAVEPAAPVLGARRGEGGAAQLLGVAAVGRSLRRAASDRQRSRDRFGRDMVAEAGEIVGHSASYRAGRMRRSRMRGRSVAASLILLRSFPLRKVEAG